MPPPPQRRGGSISVVLVRPLVLALAHDDAKLAAFYRATDLTPEMVADTEARISAAQFCVAWAQATELTKEPTLALRLASAIPQGAFGVVEYVCRSAPTLGDAIQSWVRYLGLLDDAVRVGLVPADEARGRALRVVTESEAPAPASHELCFAMIARHGASLVGPRFAVRSVHFTHRVRPETVAAHERFFGCPTRFGATHTEMIFSIDVLACPLPTSDPSLLAILLRAAEAQLKTHPQDSALLAAQVRRLLLAAPASGDQPDAGELEGVAKKLGLGGRSLQRRLKDEGTSFQALRDETRRALADRYFDQGLSIAEVSFLLGFSEPSAFFRAFKRWTGQTPIAWRAKEASA